MNGLAARSAGFGLIGRVISTSAIDILAHSAPPELVGGLFDASPDERILDLRMEAGQIV